ncbi:hypothetical protein [Corallococcus sp. CA054B]|uniref:hypothetical protein n=1 Tax=Corallococcus sp. CA054B TaxID=2316734 RepID=UPI0018F4F576|nr:hypothetical protein [Corallococcus sp. CA054B]
MRDDLEQIRLVRGILAVPGVTALTRRTWRRTMPLALHAGIAVSDYATACDWYSRLFGGPPTLVATPTQADPAVQTCPTVGQVRAVRRER